MFLVLFKCDLVVSQSMIKQLLRALPSNFILNSLFNEADAFQYIGDVVDTPLLHLELLGCLVKVHFFAFGTLDQSNEFFRKFPEGVIQTVLISGTLFWLGRSFGTRCYR